MDAAVCWRKKLCVASTLESSQFVEKVDITPPDRSDVGKLTTICANVSNKFLLNGLTQFYNDYLPICNTKISQKCLYIITDFI